MSGQVRFIAEVSSNHHRDLARCLAFIDESARIGCSAVKFQLFRIEKLFSPEILARSEMHRKRKNWELPIEFLPSLASRCKERGIQLGCTPFYVEAVEELMSFVDFYKVASYEILREDLISACGSSGKPVILSTGMATLEEIRTALKWLELSGCRSPALLHCVSGYPAPANECNLAAIETLRNEFRVEVGWSDHSVNQGVIDRAVHRFRAEIIEFHLDLDTTGDEFGGGHCWLPEQIGQVIETVKYGISADGSGIKTPVAAELPDREWRADPIDGMRPLMNMRKEFVKRNDMEK